MCIICAKPAGVKFPKNEYIENMWDGNDDGAGIMWVSNNKVHIKKGFMKFKEFKRFLGKLKKRHNIDEIPVVMHFRITTHGGTKPENTHPFPITSKIKNLQALEICTDLGVAHNGTIKIDNPPEISDTMAYIAKRLSRLRTRIGNFYMKQEMLDKVEKEITSKMCFLDNRGNLKFIGKFEEEDGVYYSNTSYLGWKKWYNYCGGYYSTSRYSKTDNTKSRYTKNYYYDDMYDDYDDWGGWKSSKTYDDVTPANPSIKTDTYTSFKTKNLMPVDGYIYNAGALFEGDVFIDETHAAYLYDNVDDICVKTEGVVYTYSGAYANFKEEKAMSLKTKEVCSFDRMAL